jgi:hypothetical protein
MDSEGRLLLAGSTDNAFTVLRLEGDVVSAVDGTGALSRRFALGQPRPNPARGVTVTTLETTSNSAVEAAVFDVAGRRIRTLVRPDELASGPRRLVWDGNGDNGLPVAAGTYFLQVRQGETLESRRITVLR